MKKLIAVLAMTLVMVACSSPESQARDTAAALGGLLTTAQNQHQTECQANPQQSVCQLINRGIAGQNALITATETYCSMPLSPTPPDPSTVCTPVKSAEPALKAAIANANQLINEIKGVVK